MDAGASTASPLSESFAIPAWKSSLNLIGAIVTAAIFLFSGFYKALDPYNFARLAQELLVPAALTMPLTWGLATAEILTGVMVLVPRFRRWGGIFATFLLLSFMIYMGARYTELQGKDCSCFPVINLPLGFTLDFRTAVGKEFFLRDATMLIPAVLAALWAKPFHGLRTASVILGAIAVFVGVSYGMEYSKHNGATAPESIVVDGKPYNLREGKQFIFFYDPECSHCIGVSKELGAFTWKKDFAQVAVPVRQQQWAADFLKDAKWNAGTALEFQKLKAAFPYTGTPYAVLLENGKQIGSIPVFEENGEPGVTLRKLGAIE